MTSADRQSAVQKRLLKRYRDEARFRAISRDFKEIALSLGVRQVTAIPVSALKGENIVMRGDAAMPWYSGPTLVEVLEKATQRTGQTTQHIGERHHPHLVTPSVVPQRDGLGLVLADAAQHPAEG